MKKIMFNDKYGLTQAVLEGKKTQTRRIINNFHNYIKVCEDAGFQPWSLSEYSKYKVGDVVAIAQPYKDCKRFKCLQESAGWNNKMFVKAELMQHHIIITNVRVERLQDISEVDCLEEGIEFYGSYYGYRIPGATQIGWRTAQIAYSVLIDNVGKRGTWDSNPWVFVYEFELID